MTRAPTADVGASMMAACPLGDSPKDVRLLGVIIIEIMEPGTNLLDKETLTLEQPEVWKSQINLALFLYRKSPTLFSLLVNFSIDGQECIITPLDHRNVLHGGTTSTIERLPHRVQQGKTKNTHVPLSLTSMSIKLWIGDSSISWDSGTHLISFLGPFLKKSSQ